MGPRSSPCSVDRLPAEVVGQQLVTGFRVHIIDRQRVAHGTPDTLEGIEQAMVMSDPDPEPPMAQVISEYGRRYHGGRRQDRGAFTP